MRPREGAGVSGYLEVFILIGVALAGSVAVWDAAAAYSAPVQGPSVTVNGESIAQGAYYAFQRLAVYNTGTKTVTSFSISTSQVASGTSFCYLLLDPVTAATLTSSCPTLSPYSGLVTLSWQILPGAAVLVELTIKGQAFAMGSTPSITVTTSAGSQTSVTVPVTPA